MLQSMTGFGNYSVDSEMGKISVDIKTLNSKNLDLNYNLSPFLKDLENDIRLIIMSSFKRGKVDIKINFKITKKQFSTNLNHELIKLYIKDLQQIVPGDAMEFLKIAISLPNSIENNQSNLDNKISNEGLLCYLDKPAPGDATGKTKTNHSGGVSGGISNGNDLVVRVFIKPTSSIQMKQETFNFETNKVEPLEIGGRHDVCIARRAGIVLENALAIVLADLYLLNKAYQ